MNRRYKAFTIIEILIAMLVLFTAIAFLNISIKAFNSYQRKSQYYQDLYITVLSLKDRMDSLTQFHQLEYKGELNGIRYNISIKELRKNRNYIVSQDGIGQNNGDFMITLYQLNMNLTKNNQSKVYKFLLTKQKKIK